MVYCSLHVYEEKCELGRCDYQRKLYDALTKILNSYSLKDLPLTYIQKSGTEILCPLDQVAGQHGLL